MRPQETRRYADEAFYFDNRQLVIDAAVLPERYPQVEAINGQSLVCTFIEASGGERTEEYGLANWRHWFQPGDQLVSVAAGTGETERELVDDEYYRYSPGGVQTGSYQLQEDDLIITEYNRQGRKGTVILSANEPMPADDEAGSRVYMPHGVITGEQKLVVWGPGATGTRWLADLALADKVTASNIDAVIVMQEFDRRSGASFVGLTSCDDILKAYLKWIENTGGEDFMPTAEPEARRREFNERLTEEQRARYF